MCGIVGFTGTKQAAPILLDGLSKLEYRGYDSAGIAVRDRDGEYEIVKAKGRLKGTIIEKKARMRKFKTTRDWNHPSMFVKKDIYNRFKYDNNN